MRTPNLVIFDLETTGLDFTRHAVVEIAAIAYDGRTMDPIPAEEGGVFQSLMRPHDGAEIDPVALKVNGLTMEELNKAPHPEAVWRRFLAYLKQFNPKGQVTTAPIAGGKNIRNFDLPFIAKLSERYSPNGAKQVVFNRREQIDLEDLLRHWHWCDPELTGMSMDVVRERYGLGKAGHRALIDVQQTGEMISRLMKLTWELRNRMTVNGERLIDFNKLFEGI